jgi:glycosyltransferase involved in cell wall biosynthesis
MPENCGKSALKNIMRIWIATEFFDSPADTVGGYYVKGVAEELALTENVEVVFPNDNSSSEIKYSGKISFNHIHQFNYNRKNLITRTIGQLLVSFQFFIFLLPRVKKDDLVLSFTHPTFIIFICVWLKKLKTIKVIVINYDLFPEILVATGSIRDNWFYRSILKMYNRAYNNTDTIISLGEEMTRNIKNKLHNDFTKIFTIPNWADTENICFEPKETNEIILEHGLETKFVFSYAGTIGRCQGINKLLNLINNLENINTVHFLFFGKGVAINSFLEQVSANRNQELITYAGFIITDDKKQFINACDIAVISLLDEMDGLNFPSKTYNILASGHPILFVGKETSELAKMIHTHDIGWVCSSSDSDMFQKIIFEIVNQPAEIKRKGDKSRTIAEKYFEKKYILKQYVEAIKYNQQVFVNESIINQTLGK